MCSDSCDNLFIFLFKCLDLAYKDVADNQHAEGEADMSSDVRSTIAEGESSIEDVKLSGDVAESVCHILMEPIANECDLQNIKDVHVDSQLMHV